MSDPCLFIVSAFGKQAREQQLIGDVFHRERNQAGEFFDNVNKDQCWRTHQQRAEMCDRSMNVLNDTAIWLVPEINRSCSDGAIN